MILNEKNGAQIELGGVPLTCGKRAAFARSKARPESFICIEGKQEKENL